MAGNHLQRALDLIASKKKESKEIVPAPLAFDPDTNGHQHGAHGTKKSCGELLRNSTNTPAEKKKARSKKKEYSLLDLARANRELERDNLVYRKRDVEKVLEWLSTVTEVALDTETYAAAGGASTKEKRKKLALSFVRGKIRLIQLSDGETTYLIDAALLSKVTVARVLEALKGKVLYLHNAVFDLPRLKRHFGVDLMGEDVRDTMVLSRLARAGEWVEDWRRKSDTRPLGHSLAEALSNELVAEIPDETDHLWHEPLNEKRLEYAVDDVMYLITLERKLMRLVADRGLREGLRLFERVLPIYMRMQYRGVPFDKGLFDEFTEKVDAKISETWARIREHAPLHPEGGEWCWGNSNKFDPEKAQKRFEAGQQKTPLCPGRNGALRALAETGVKLGNLKKPTRIEYLKKHPGEAALLRALHEHLGYSDLKSDCADWLKYHCEDGRLYPNVKPFSQVTGRSAFSEPALQNIPKEADPEIGISLRECIRAPKGSKLIKADYAAQELRILAHVAGDENLIKAFTEGDPHVVVAEKVAGRKLEKGTEDYKTYRKLGKRANYGFSYGAGPARYAQSVYEDTAERISEKQAKAEQAAFRAAWPGVYKWQQGFGDRDGADPKDWYTLSFVGRRRYVGQKKDQRTGQYKPNYCDRLNAPIQSGGADMLYAALERLVEDQEAGLHPEAEVVITTHDEIVLECREDDAEVKGWLEEHMRDAAARFLRPELTGEDCVEAEEGPGWG